MLHAPGKVAAIAWVALWVGVAAVGITLVNARGGTTPGEVPLVASGRGAAELNGVTAAITAVESSPLETVVRLRFDGRESEGFTVNLTSRSKLTVGDTVLNERAGHADGRTVTLYFDGLPADVAGRDLKVYLSGVTISSQPAARATEADQVDIGNFILEAPPQSVVARDSTAENVEASAAFGSGRLTTSQLLRDDDGLVVRARLDGFTAEQIQVISLAPANLHLASGASLGFVSIRSGFGDDLRDVELRFPPTDEPAVGVSVTFTVARFTPDPTLAEARSSIAQWDGQVGLVSFPR
jgi:hypothetical protein